MCPVSKDAGARPAWVRIAVPCAGTRKLPQRLKRGPQPRGPGGGTDRIVQLAAAGRSGLTGSPQGGSVEFRGSPGGGLPLTATASAPWLLTRHGPTPQASWSTVRPRVRGGLRRRPLGAPEKAPDRFPDQRRLGLPLLRREGMDRSHLVRGHEFLRLDGDALLDVTLRCHAGRSRRIPDRAPPLPGAVHPIGRATLKGPAAEPRRAVRPARVGACGRQRLRLTSRASPAPTTRPIAAISSRSPWES